MEPQTSPNGIDAGDVPSAIVQASSQAQAKSAIRKILDSVQEGEEKMFTEEIRAALQKSDIELSAEQQYLAVAFVRGFIYDTFKDRKDRVALTVQELTEAVKFRSNVRESFSDLDTPELQALFEKHMHSFIPKGGFDFDGNPLWILDLPSQDFDKHLTNDQVKAYHARDFMKLEELKLESSLRHNKFVWGHVIVADMSHCTGGLGGAIGVAKRFNASLEVQGEDGKSKNMDQFYFPESMRSALILNAPWWFQAMWKVVSLFLEPATRKKVRVLGADYGDVLFERGILGHLPRYLGGCSDNPNALSMREFGEGVDIIGRVDASGNPQKITHSVKSGRPVRLRICFSRNKGVRWKVDVTSRNAVIVSTGYLRRSGKNETIPLSSGEKFEAGTAYEGSFDRRSGNNSSGGSGNSVENTADVVHGFVVFEISGSSSFRSTTVTLHATLYDV